MKTSGAIVLAILCSGAAFAAGWFLHAPAANESAGVDADGTGTGAEKAPEDAMLGSDAMQLASVRRELADEKERHEKTKGELAELRAAPSTEKPAEAGTPTVDTVMRGPRYSFPKVAEVLSGVNWTATGEGVAKMGPLMIDFVESVRSGQGLPSNVGELQRWNAPLATMAINARKQGLSGTGIPGTFSHPSIVVNLVDAALKQGGLPLTDEQAERLGKLGQAFVNEDERRLGGYDESILQVQKTVEEALLKERLYVAVDALLTEEQREVLHPSVARGRCAFDTFSSAVIWAAICAPIKFQTRTDLAQSLVRIAIQRGQIPPEHQPALQEVATEWAQGFDEDYLAEEPDALFREGIGIVGATHGMPVVRATVAGPRAVAFYRALLERLPADSNAATQLRSTALIPVPVKWVEQPEGE